MIESNDLRDELQKGGQAAFAEQFSQYRDRLRRTLTTRLNRRHRVRTDMSDILQESYIAAWQRIDHFVANPNVSFYVWLREVTLQRLIDSHRHHVTAQRRSVNLEDNFSARNSSSTQNLAAHFVARLASPSQLAVHDEMIERVNATLESMSPNDREVLILRHFEELMNSEVAEVLGISVAAASNRYVRALKRLQEALVSDADFVG